nr:ribonuclease H-like domain-containing protein [Tanacetum cinerariifolium]
MSHQLVSSSLLHTSSSSPAVLVASTTPHDKANTMNTSGFGVCHNYQRDSFSYGARCKFVHGGNDLRTRPPTTSSTAQGRVPSNSMNRPLQAVTNMVNKPAMSNTNRNSVQSVVAQCQSPQPTHMGYVYFNTGPGYYASTSVSNNDSSTTKLEHGYWASSLLAENISMLTSFSNPSLYESVFVGNGQPIPDYQTRRLLLRCDSTGDLYPVTQQPSSSTTFALLSSNPTMWHKRLGHPSEDVLRRLESSRFISCNKTKHKYNADGSLSRYKARLVANVRSQQQGIDCDATFSPVVEPATISIVLSLSRSLYGLKQAHRAWFQQFASFITRVGFQHNKTDTSLFVYHQGSDIAYLLLYVDHIILTASSTALLQRIITVLHGEFAMTDLGSLNYFLGISAHERRLYYFCLNYFLGISEFAMTDLEEILKWAHMQHCNPCKTSVDTESKLGSDGDSICLYMHDPRDLHFHALKRILRYVRGTIDHGLQLHVSSTSQLTAFTDPDWAGCFVTLRSTSRYCVFLGDNLLSWFAKRQVTLSRSIAEAEYRDIAIVVAEAA